MSDDHQPIEPEVRARMNRLAEYLSSELPQGWGFVLLSFKFGEQGRMNYISNANRQDMLTAIDEFLTNARKDQ